MRNSGIGALGDVAWGTRICQFYQTKSDLTDVLTPYFKAGLEANELCIWITSPPLPAPAAREALQEAVPGLADYFDRGQMEIVSYADWYLAGGEFDSQRVLSAWAAKLHDAFGNLVHIILDRFGDLVEQLMQADKARPFHIPMRLLHLHLQIHGVGQPLVQQQVHFRPDF